MTTENNDDQPGDASMVTILPIDVDHDLVREGLQFAVAERMQGRLREIQAQLAELRAGSLIERDRWQAAFAGLAALHAEMAPVLEYAKAFVDQWPDGDEQ